MRLSTSPATRPALWAQPLGLHGAVLNVFLAAGGGGALCLLQPATSCACRPPLAYAAVQAEPSIGLLLPCNVVVRALDETHTSVEAMDPAIMVTLTGNDALAEVAADASTRLTAALHSLHT